MIFGNNVVLVGNLTSDPELQFTTSGKTYGKCSLAINERSKDADGEQKDRAHFYDVTCWAPLAENIAASLHKGDRVIVTGALEYSSWEAQDGTKRSKLSIRADSIGPDLRWATCTIEKTAFGPPEPE